MMTCVDNDSFNCIQDLNMDASRLIRFLPTGVQLLGNIMVDDVV